MRSGPFRPLPHVLLVVGGRGGRAGDADIEKKDDSSLLALLCDDRMNE